MATRSFIGKTQSDGQIKSIYCHWDGHLEHNGAMLQCFYQDEYKIDALLDNGDLSALGIEVGVSHDWEEFDTKTCTFYHRDRGESKEETKAKIFATEADFLESAHDNWTEFVYLRKEGIWFYQQTRYGPPWVALNDVTQMKDWVAAHQASLNLCTIAQS